MFKKFVAVVAVIAFVLGTFAVGNYVTAEAKDKGAMYEYRIIGLRLQPRSAMEEGKKRLMADEMQTEFNYQGGEGWEFAGTFPGKEDAIFFVFKKHK